MRKLGELSVNDYMTSQAITVFRTDRLTDAIRIMDEEELSALPVLNEKNQLVGILSTSDLIEITHEIQADIGALAYVTEKTQDFLIKLLMEQGDHTMVGDVMTSPVESVAVHANLVVAARKLVDQSYHHLPVLNEEGKLVGIVSTTDFVRAIADYGAMAAG